MNDLPKNVSKFFFCRRYITILIQLKPNGLEWEADDACLLYWYILWVIVRTMCNPKPSTSHYLRFTYEQSIVQYFRGSFYFRNIHKLSVNNVLHRAFEKLHQKLTLTYSYINLLFIFVVTVICSLTILMVSSLIQTEKILKDWKVKHIVKLIIEYFN